MNAAARLVHQNILSRHLVFVRLNRQQLLAFILAISVLLSAISIIYVTHLTRIWHAAFEHTMAERDRLHVVQGQLLLERSTWTMQSRVQHIAEKKLNMMMPNHQSIVVIRE